MANKIKLTI